MSLRKIIRMIQSSVNDDTTSLRRSTKVRRSLIETNALPEGESEEEPSRKKPIGRCKNKRKCIEEQEQQFPEHPLVTADHEILVYETGDWVPVVKLPSSLKEEKLKCDRLCLVEPELKPEDRQHLQAAASVYKSYLVSHIKSSAHHMSYKDMTLLASECYDILRELQDDYTSFQSEVSKLIAQHRKVESDAKDKENFKEWDGKARYIHQVEVLSELRQKLSGAQKELLGAETKVDCLMCKEEELTGAIRKLKNELYEVEDRIEILTEERDQFQEACSGLEVEHEKLDAEMMEASAAVEAYNAAKGDFERISKHLLQFVKNQ